MSLSGPVIMCERKNHTSGLPAVTGVSGEWRVLILSSAVDSSSAVHSSLATSSRCWLLLQPHRRHCCWRCFGNAAAAAVAWWPQTSSPRGGTRAAAAVLAVVQPGWQLHHPARTSGQPTQSARTWSGALGRSRGAAEMHWLRVERLALTNTLARTVHAGSTTPKTSYGWGSCPR
jgi:hypothetical protein